MAGFGLQPFGTSPFGTGSVAAPPDGGGSTGVPTVPAGTPQTGGVTLAAPVLRLEAGFDVLSGPGSTTFRLGSSTAGVLGVNTLGGDQVWQDISQYLRYWTTTRSSDRSAGQTIRTYAPGSLTCTLKNGDRRFDPLNLAGPYVVSVGAGSTTMPFTISPDALMGSSGGASPRTQVDPMRPIRLTAVMGAAEFRLFTGYVDTWGPSYIPPFYGESQVVASDYLKVLGKNDRAAQAVTLGAGEFGGERIARVLTDSGYTGPRDLSRGDVTMVGTTLEGDALTEIQAAAQAEAGDVYADGDGTIVFRTRMDGIKQPAQAVSQGTFADGTPGGEATEMPAYDVSIAYDESTLVNIAQVTRAGGDQVQEARDDVSVQRYLPAVYTSSELPFATDDQAGDYAQLIVTSSSTPELRITQLVIRPITDVRLWPQVLGRRVGDRITVVLRPPGGGTPIRREVIIRGIAHNCPTIPEWETTWQTSTAPPVNFLVLGSAVSGVLGQNILF